ncbi:MAG: cell division/cell wall cluster transcriptional repressor MraZ [Deltaproteobacteria bacterium]|jgi:MraZ protein|nr:cell division/cell wall cluster transcriptional repressor MraZ [Deltaproteobacteria bacterium]
MQLTRFTFCGRFDHALDDKGRIMLPSPFREELRVSVNPDRLYVGCYPGTGHLSLYPVERWMELVEAWKDEKRFQSTTLMLEAQRMFFANIEPVALDRVGRILIPAIFREKASLVREASVLGVADKLEIWSPDRLREQEQKAADLWQQALDLERARPLTHGGTEGYGDAPRLPQW